MFLRSWILIALCVWISSCNGDATEGKQTPDSSTILTETTAEIEKANAKADKVAGDEQEPELKATYDDEKEPSTGAQSEKDESKETTRQNTEPPSKELQSGRIAVNAADEPTAQNHSCIVSNQTQWSWLVKIMDKQTNKQVCTGTLITDEDVLVPASCFLKNTTEVEAEFYEIGKKLLALAGGGIDYNCTQIRNVSVIYPHKGYFTSTEDHDYAFLKVSPEFEVDDEDIPDLRYHLNVINSEGGLVNIHNNNPFCQSPYFVNDELNTLVAEEHHLLGMRIDDCMMKWNCSADYDTCLSYLHPAHYACLKPLTPRNCSKRDRGAPLVCDDVFLGYLHLCDGDLPMVFRGLNKAIKFLELEDDHIQQPGYMGRRY